MLVKGVNNYASQRQLVCIGCHNKRCAKLNKRHPMRAILVAAKCRAKKRGLPFDLTEADVHVPAKCPALGIPLAHQDGRGHHSNSPSLDRIIPGLGYVKGNIIVVSALANSIKWTATPDQIIKVGLFYKKLLEERGCDVA